MGKEPELLCTCFLACYLGKIYTLPLPIAVVLNEAFRALSDPHAAAAAKSLQSCLTLCDPMDGSPPGSPVPGILQARTLEWVAISFSKA